MAAIRDEAAAIARPDRAAPRHPRRAGDRPRPAPDPGARCSPRWTGCRWRSAPGDGPDLGDRGAARRQAGPDRAAARRHGRAAGHRADRPAVRLQVDGVMHACGHDLHTAMLAGAARLLSARQAELAGNVIFMFQPGEEGPGGARHDDRRGRARRGRASGRSRPTRCTWPPACCRSGCSPAGPGPIMAAADTLQVTVARPRRARLPAAPRRRPDPGRLRDRDWRCRRW